MPCTYRLYPRHNLIVKSLSGRITTRCALELLDRIADDPGVHPGILNLDDLRKLVDFQVAQHKLSKLTDLLRGINIRDSLITRKAILTTASGPAHTAALRIQHQAAILPGVDIRVFTTARAAMGYLGVMDSSLERQISWTGATAA